MPQLLANLNDINKWLSDHKVEAGDSNTANFQVEANRIVKSRLSGVFTPTIIRSWDSPDNTPGMIRSIAGELIAAFLYRELYAEDVTDVPVYAKTLYDEAIQNLIDIKTGALTVLDATDTPIDKTGGLTASTNDFFPTNATPGPYFEMESIW